MGLSTEIKAYIPDTNEEYQRQKAVLLACHKAGVSMPKETQEYFGSEYLDLYLLDEKLEVELVEGQHFTAGSEGGCSWIDVDLSKMPEGVSKIRFSNCW